MKTILAVNPGYARVEAVVSPEGSGLESSLGRWVFPADTCDFAAIEREVGSPPSLLAIPGGIYNPSNPGIYRINSKMAEHAKEVDSFHPRNRLTVLAHRYCLERSLPGVAVEPMNTGELIPEARLSGLRTHQRRGVYYALPQRQAWEDSRRSLGLPPSARGVTAYLGEESSVSSHVGNTVVDTSDPVLGEGPFGLQAAGTLPAGGYLAYLSQHPVSDLTSSLKAGAGAFGYAKVRTLDELASALSSGDKAAVCAVSALGYQVAKEIGRQVTALSGKVDAIVVCGPASRLAALKDRITGLVGKWAPVVTYEETELDLLFSGGTSVLRGEVPKEY